jgi:hypothetical protein
MADVVKRAIVAKNLFKEFKLGKVSFFETQVFGTGEKIF